MKLGRVRSLLLWIQQTTSLSWYYRRTGIISAIELKRDWIAIKMWLKTWPCMKTSGPLTSPCEVTLRTRCADCFYREVRGTILVTYSAHGLVEFSRCKVCAYTSCRNHVESDKISKPLSRILLPFCLITLAKDKLDFMPQSPTMCMVNFKHIPQSIEVYWLHSSMAAIGITIMIKNAQAKWPQHNAGHL